MGKRIAIACILLGVLCLLGAIGLVLSNRQEAQSAARIAPSLLQEAQIAIQEQVTKDTPEAPTDVTPNTDAPEITPEETTEIVFREAPTEMATVNVDGEACIGILSIPVLELELPVLADWSYAKLKKAPCHYYGSCYGKDFVIAAHNYQAHFGRLSQLQSGDIVVFTDATGEAHTYAVMLLETLPKEATREMIASGFDLSLYTCTPGGGNRVTVRCIAK